jgi:hypothetical protein
MYFRNLTAVAALPLQQHAGDVAIAERLDFPADVVDFEKAEDHVRQSDEPEGQRRIDAAGDALRLA